MSIKVKCPGCTKTLTVPDAARGKAVKCPSCESRVAVPDEDAGAAVAAGKGKKPGKKAGPVEDEAGLAGLDLRKVADHEANVCPKCGYDLDLATDDEEQEITECPECGWDLVEGGLGEKARKKALKGPDPDKFYQGLWKTCWKFVSENYFLAFRTFAYTMAASAIMFAAYFMFLWMSPVPPRVFFLFVTLVSGMVLPGWLWYLDTEVIKLTMVRKDKFKRLNFDFFLASALGVKFVFWNFVFAGPLLILPFIIALTVCAFMGLPGWIPLVTALVLYLPIFGMWPVVLTHMTMPIQGTAWMFWKVIPISLRCFKALFTWFLLVMVTNLPVLLIGGATLFFAGSSLLEYTAIMGTINTTNRIKSDWEYYERSKNKPKTLIDPKWLTEPVVTEDSTITSTLDRPPGALVYPGTLLLRYEGKDGKTLNLRSMVYGTLDELRTAPGQQVKAKTPLALITPITSVEFKHELAITIGMVSWLVCGLIVAFTSLFAMRANGYFAYYFREHLDLQVLMKETKYVASLPREGAEKKKLTINDMFAQAGVTVLISVLVFAMFRAVLSSAGAFQEELTVSLVEGTFQGLMFSIWVGFSVITKAAWSESPMWGICTQWFNVSVGVVIAAVLITGMLGTALPLPLVVFIGLLGVMGLLSIIAAFVFVIQFWDDAGAGCLTAIVASMVVILWVPIAILAFGTDLLAPLRRGDRAAQQGPPQPGGGDPRQGGAPGALPGGPGAPGAVPGGPGGPPAGPAPISSPPVGGPGGAAAPGAPNPAGAPKAE